MVSKYGWLYHERMVEGDVQIKSVVRELHIDISSTQQLNELHKYHCSKEAETTNK